MPGNNLISVVIPHKNRSDLLEQALQSVFAQTYQPHEIIVVDDASYQEQKETIRNFKIKNGWNFNWIELPSTGGPSVARNEGIKHASGDFIAFLDADDLWSPQHLSFFARAFEKHKNIEFYSSGIILTRKKQCFC